jgi:hypothetical protein
MLRGIMVFVNAAKHYWRSVLSGRQDRSDLGRKNSKITTGGVGKRGRMAKDNRWFINGSIMDYQNRRSLERFTS